MRIYIVYQYILYFFYLVSLSMLLLYKKLATLSIHTYSETSVQIL